MNPTCLDVLLKTLGGSRQQLNYKNDDKQTLVIHRNN